MTYEVEVTTTAARQIARIPNPDQRRIVERIERLGADPRPANATKLQGIDAWRVRQGTYRIVYTIDDAVRIVTVTRVGHRREVYR